MTLPVRKLESLPVKGMEMIQLIKKAFFKVVHLNPIVDRLVRYQNPKKYWQERGGDPYFVEQEAVYDRTLRSQFITGEINKLPYKSLLEIGCGYGKQLRNFRCEEAKIVGCDYSRQQLLKAKDYCDGIQIFLLEADAESLPFSDKSFDVVFSSAVILHNHFEKAKKIISEMIRIGRRFIVHNEDTDITFSRFGYDMKKTHEKMNHKIIKSGLIPSAPDPSITQFTIVELPSAVYLVKPEDVTLQYHR